ncbi:MAG: hypothetical protein HY257_05215 [Chloroflexi bacterium]|nr:hypothetical protein [Chloroflexota bacterium]
MKNKKFDCVELQDRGAMRIYQQTGKMSIQEQLTYWQKQTQALQKRQRAAQQKYSRQQRVR